MRVPRRFVDDVGWSALVRAAIDHWFASVRGSVQGCIGHVANTMFSVNGVMVIVETVVMLVSDLIVGSKFLRRSGHTSGLIGAACADTGHGIVGRR